MTHRDGRLSAGLAAIILAAAILALGAAACAPTSGRWEGGPQDDADAAAVAQADCRAAARADAERTFPDRPSGAPSPSSAQPRDVGGPWINMMDRYSAQTREQSMFERCMTQRGLRFVPNSP